MATHNDGPLLHEAIASICNGTYPVDLYVIDDCSNPPAQVPVPSDLNIRLIRLDENLGLTRALNHGLRHILVRAYDYVGRMDADDISHPERIEKQVEFLEANRNIAGVGCWANYIDASTKLVTFKCQPSTEPDAIRNELYSNNCLLHPTWLMRARVFEELGGYNEDFRVAQDYEFVARASNRGYEFANLPEILLDYRISPSGISVKKRRQQLLARLRIQAGLFSFSVPASWIGLTKTLLLFAVPASLVKRMKSARFLKTSTSASP